jgi:hypothetical protein
VTLRSRGHNAVLRQSGVWCSGPGLDQDDPSAPARVVDAIFRIPAHLFPSEVMPFPG